MPNPNPRYRGTPKLNRRAWRFGMVLRSVSGWCFVPSRDGASFRLGMVLRSVSGWCFVPSRDGANRAQQANRPARPAGVRWEAPNLANYCAGGVGSPGRRPDCAGSGAAITPGLAGKLLETPARFPFLGGEWQTARSEAGSVKRIPPLDWRRAGLGAVQP